MNSRYGKKEEELVGLVELLKCKEVHSVRRHLSSEWVLRGLGRRNCH